MGVIWGRREEEYFWREDWTGGIELIWLKKLVFGRNAPHQPRNPIANAGRF